MLYEPFEKISVFKLGPVVDPALGPGHWFWPGYQVLTGSSAHPGQPQFFLQIKTISFW
jgi:hypothetical protein